MTLNQPYSNAVPEPNTYEEIATHSERGKLSSNNPEDFFPDLHIASKEGFMTKRGAIRKNWNQRWFVLNKNFLRYYKRRDSSSPIRTFDLRKASEVCECSIDGKENCFKVVMPSRIFYMRSDSAYESEQWNKILRWKVEYYVKVNSNIVRTVVGR